MRTRKTAYYSRNDSFSRSYNAETAEEEGRLPRSRAAASLGLSVAAFDAGCSAVGYRATEWHHVGKFAARIDYYDCAELGENPEFWRGAAAAYKSAKKRAEILATMARRAEAERVARVEEFLRKIIENRDCTRFVLRHSTEANWISYCRLQFAAAGITGPNVPTRKIAPGDKKSLENAVAAGGVLAEWTAMLRNGEPAGCRGRPMVRVGRTFILQHSGGYVNLYRENGFCIADAVRIPIALELLKEM